MSLGDVIKEVVGILPYLWKSACDYFTRQRAMQFFGASVLQKDKFWLVFDPYSQAAAPSATRCYKDLRGLTTDVATSNGRLSIVGETHIFGRNTLRSVQHALNGLAWMRKSDEPLLAAADEGLVGKWDGSFVAFGSRDSNLRTLEIEQHIDPAFYEMPVPKGASNRAIRIGGQQFPTSHGANAGGFGVVVRVKNPQAVGEQLFICAGLGGHGTSGAAWYLFRKWREIRKRHGKRDFAIVVETQPTGDETARVVYEFAR